MRLIDADALINEIKKETEKAIEQDDRVGSFWLGYIAGLVIKQPTIQTEPHWIPVSERLPEEHESMFAKYYNTPKWNNCMWLKESGKMLVSVEVPGNEIIVDTAKMINGKWFFGLSFVDKKVIAWMPLPTPYTK